MLHGFGALRRCPSRLLLRVLLQLIWGRRSHLSARMAADVLVALARLRRPVSPAWVRGLLRKALGINPAQARATQGAEAGSGHSDAHPVAAAAASFAAADTGSSSVRTSARRVDVAGARCQDSAPLPAASGQPTALPPAGGSLRSKGPEFHAAARLLWALGKLGTDPGPSTTLALIEAMAASAAEVEQQAAHALSQLQGVGMADGSEEDHNTAAARATARAGTGLPGDEAGNVVADTEHESSSSDEHEVDMSVDALWRWQLLKQARWGATVLGYAVP